MSAIFGELLNFSQENGPDVRLQVFGDEHYARYEDIDGYTVIYDKVLGQFCYADLAGNRFVSTGVTLDLPPPANIVRHLQESQTVKLAKIEERALLHQVPEGASFERIVRTFGPNQGLLNGRQLSIGRVRGLTILVNFQDVTSTTTAADVSEMINGDNFTRNGNICSVRQYFLQVSNDKLDYTNTVVGPFTLSQNRQHYIDNLLVEEALQLAVASGLDLTQFDSRDEGIIDALNILYAGQSVYQEELWPHNSFIDLRFGSMRTNLYLLTGLGRNPNELSIGTFCHENGHLLCRFPDMYDYGKRDGDAQNSAGIGYYCLMGAGNHLDSGRSPSPVCAYLRDLAGWCDTAIDLNAPGSYQAVHGDYGTVLKYRTSKPNEYFLVENRMKMGLDRAGTSNGLAVYHCDILGSNELQQGTPNQHYQCALLQADGRRDLEDDQNQGDGSDLFGPVPGVVVTSTSRPHSREWDGRESGLVISDITLGNGQISFAKNQAKRGGGQVGHVGVGRKVFSPTEADERRIAAVRARVCETCCCALKRQGANERAIYELEGEKVRKVHYQIERKKSPVCRKIVSGRVENAFARVGLSNELVVEVAEQHYLLGRSLGQISERFKISEATIFSSLKRIGEKLKPSLENLKQIYRCGQVRHADETGWRTDGASGYAWYFGTEAVSLYLFRQTRSASVVEEVFGKERLNEVLVVDQYGGYNRVGCSIQYCYAHLLRKQEDLAKEFPKSREVRTYTSQMIKRLSQAMKLRKAGLSESQYQKEAAKIKQKILNLSKREAKHPAVRRWQDFYVEKAARLYQWCRSAQIPAENNYAEREIRKIVIARKNSYGSQSQAGAETREIWTSVLESLKKREANPREKLVEGLNKLSADENFDIAEFLFGNSKSKPD